MTPMNGDQARWRIDEGILPHGDTPDCAMRDSVFALANGRFGCKGTRPGAAPGRQGTFVAGLFDDATAYGSKYGIKDHRWIWPVAPNLFSSSFGTQRVLDPASLSRTLDMKRGVLLCRGEAAIDGARWRVLSERFVSWADKRLAVERLTLTPIDHCEQTIVTLGMDHTPLNRHGATPFSVWSEHTFSTSRAGAVLYRGTTRGSAQSLSAATAVACEQSTEIVRMDGSTLYRVGVSGPTTIVRFVALDSGAHAAVVVETVGAALARGYDAALEDHTAAVARFWNRADCEIDGPEYDQQAVRFCLYCLGGALTDSAAYSYGAKLLAGQHYWGVVFWDADIYVVPWLTRVFPEKAKLHLEFRHRGLASARAKAREFGYRGAMYPWNAAPDGSESNLGVYGRNEVHITADVAWALVDYVEQTGDQAFMESKGWEILAECARFWESRIAPDTGSIDHVCGPDEYATDVNNNAFTNYLARWVLQQAADRCRGKVTDEEAEGWLAAAARIPQPKKSEDGVWEQYDGYFELPMREISSEHKAEHKGYAVLKQADVLVLPYILPGCMSDSEIRANYEFYRARTDHRSSLSLAPYALAAARVGLAQEARDFLVRAASTDLRNRWATDDGGLHGAACASVPYTLMQWFSSESSAAATRPREWKAVRVRACKQ